jgi:hypothetical protein
MTKLTMTSKCTSVAANFEGLADAPEQYRQHRPMRRVQGYYGSHWTPASGDYSLCIAPAATRATGIQTTINKHMCEVGHFDGHGDAPVRNRAHCPMEEVQSFNRSHWTPPLGEYYVQ